jgi:hypothetical protein
LLDSEGGEIRATFFKEACDKFYATLEEGKVRRNRQILYLILTRFLLKVV